MPDIDQLVQLITDRLLEKTQALADQPSVYLIGKNETAEWLMQQGYRVVNQLELADQLVVDQLDLAAFLRVAALCPTTEEETILLTALLEGKSVWVAAGIFDISRYKQSSRSALYRDLLKQQAILEKYGIHYYKDGQLLDCLSSGTAERPKISSPTVTVSQPDLKGGRLITESRLRSMGLSEGDSFQLQKGMIITALARDYLKRHKINLIK